MLCIICLCNEFKKDFFIWYCIYGLVCYFFGWDVDDFFCFLLFVLLLKEIIDL